MIVCDFCRKPAVHRVTITPSLDADLCADCKARIVDPIFVAMAARIRDTREGGARIEKFELHTFLVIGGAE